MEEEDEVIEAEAPEVPLNLQTSADMDIVYALAEVQKLNEAGRIGEAVEWAFKAYRMDQSFPMAIGAAAVAYSNEAEWWKSKELYEEHQRWIPGNPRVTYSLGFVNIALGLCEGWKQIQAGLATSRSLLHPFVGPLDWDKPYYIYTEQGHGDAVMLMRLIHKMYIDNPTLPRPEYVQCRRDQIEYFRKKYGHTLAFASEPLDKTCPSGTFGQMVSIFDILGHYVDTFDSIDMGSNKPFKYLGDTDEVSLFLTGNPKYKKDNVRSITDPGDQAHYAELIAGLVDRSVTLYTDDDVESQIVDVLPKPKSFFDLIDVMQDTIVMSVDSLPIHMAGDNNISACLIPQLGGEWRWGPGFKPYDTVLSYQVPSTSEGMQTPEYVCEVYSQYGL